MAESDSSLTTMDWLSAMHVKMPPSKNEFLDSSLSLTSPSSSRDPFDDFSTFEREGGKPSHSYSTLIKLAISSSRSKRMSLRQIYKWISDNFPYYKDARNGWKNSIRHNLSLNKCFVKVPRDKGDMGKGCYWSIREGVPHERPATLPAGMRPPVIAVSGAGDVLLHQQAVVSSSSSVSRDQEAQIVAKAQPSVNSLTDGIPELTNSTVGSLSALIGSQSDQMFGAPFAPAAVQSVVQPPPQPVLTQTQPMPHQQQHYLQQQERPMTTPPPPLSPPSGDQLSLSASLQTICRSLLAESSSGSSGIGALANVVSGSAGGIDGGSGGGSSQPPDLSASTLDFVQKMLPQLKDSFQLSESALQDLWGHCQSTSRPATTIATEPSPHQAGDGIPLPMAELRRQRLLPMQPPVAAPAAQQSRPLPKPEPHRQGDAGQDVEDDFNWDSIL